MLVVAGEQRVETFDKRNILDLWIQSRIGSYHLM